MFIPIYVSCVTCHVSHVTCHVSCVTCHLYHVTCHFFSITKKIGQCGGASRWKVCYQRGLPRLVQKLEQFCWIVGFFLLDKVVKLVGGGSVSFLISRRINIFFYLDRRAFLYIYNCICMCICTNQVP